MHFASTLVVLSNFRVHLQGTLTGMAEQLGSISQAAAASAMAAESAATHHLDDFQAHGASHAAAAAEVRKHIGSECCNFPGTNPQDDSSMSTVSCATEGAVWRCCCPEKLSSAVTTQICQLHQAVDQGLRRPGWHCEGHHLVLKGPLSCRIVYHSLLESACGLQAN